MRIHRKSLAFILPFTFAISASIGLANSAVGQQQPAIDQATATSRHTGAPMLVIAGRET